MSSVQELAVPLIKKSEGLRLEAYKCPAGVWTIGWGHTGGVKAGQKITRLEAGQLLAEDFHEAYRAVHSLITKPSHLTSAQCAALVDFTFNLGAWNLKRSTLLKRVNAGDFADVPRQLRRWIHGGGKVLPGLVTRREAEVKLWSSS